MTTEKEKKQRVLHTRVSESLDQELRDRAANLGVSVSNLVRNVLSSTFGLVEAIVADTADVARAARGEATIGDAVAPPGSATAAPVTVVGWQPMVLNLNAVCSECNALLPKGSDAAIAITDGAGPRPVICQTCLKGVRENASNEPAE